MLVLTRKPGQCIAVGDDIEIVIMEVNGKQVRVGIRAPKDIEIHRWEVFEQIKKERAKSAVPAPTSPDHSDPYDFRWDDDNL